MTPAGGRRWLLGLSLGLLLGGCAKPTPAVPVAKAAAPPLHLSPLSDLAPAAGLRWFLAARVGTLVQPHALGRPLAELVSADRLDALSDLLGFDPRLADEVIVADYGASTLFLFRVAHDPELVERRFRERVPGEVTRVVHEPRVVRIAGTVGRTRRSMVFLDGQAVALEVGGEAYAKATVGFATEKLHKAKPALAIEPLASLAASFDKDGASPPLLLLCPNPAKEPWSLGAHGLLEVTSAVGIAARPQDDGLAVELAAVGQYGERPDPVRERVEATVHDVVLSPLGTLTGVAEPKAAYTYEIGRERVTVRARWDAVKIAQGLRAATSATIAEIVKK